MSEQRGPDSPENPYAGQGAVMLDIGGDIGALVVTMPVEMAGMEVDIVPEGQAAATSSTRRDGDDHGHGDDGSGDERGDHGHGHGHGHGDRPHVAVVRRPVAGGELPSLVYPELVEGRYELLVKGTDEVVLAVDVVGGQVAEATWPTRSPA